MAKKSFIGGLDSLIEDSLGLKKETFTEKTETTEIKTDNNEPDAEQIKLLKSKILQLSQELLLWRSGKLTYANFANTLAKYSLKYNSNANEIEEI